MFQQFEGEHVLSKNMPLKTFGNICLVAFMRLEEFLYSFGVVGLECECFWLGLKDLTGSEILFFNRFVERQWWLWTVHSWWYMKTCRFRRTKWGCHLSRPGLDMSELKNPGYLSANYLVFAGSQVRDCMVLLWNEKVFRWNCHWNVNSIQDCLFCHFTCILLLHSLFLLRALEVLLCSISLIKTLVSQAGSMHREAFVPDNSPVQQTESVRQACSLQV